MSHPDQPTDRGPQSAGPRLWRGGLFASIAYILSLGLYAWWQWPAMLALRPDEVATFLSGVFAPLAFLWLVLGFRQQGDELQNSARALWLQGEELRHSVEQQRQLVEVSRQQVAAEHEALVRAELEAERAAQPLLQIGGMGGSYSGPCRTLSYKLTNAGPNCADVSLIIGGVVIQRRGLLVVGGEIPFQRNFANPNDVTEQAIRVEYSDERGRRRAQMFRLPVDEAGGPNRDRTLGEAIKLPGIERLHDAFDGEAG